MEGKENIYEKLIVIQNKLKVPKNHHNSYGNYDFRNCEDICEAAKPILKEYNLALFLTDELVMVGDRYYVKAKALLTDGNQSIEVYGYAREEEAKKGMDGSQITSSSSSYARKSALSGMFLIDDMKDTEEEEKAGNNERLKLYKRINELELELDFPHERILDEYHVKSNNEMTTSQLQNCIIRLEKKLEDRKEKK